MKTVQIIHIIEDERQQDLLWDAFHKLGYRLHHSATQKGYISRKTKGCVTDYLGRFGSGYIYHRPLYNGTQYHMIEYWVKKEIEP